jgi:hypothetical protein
MKSLNELVMEAVNGTVSESNMQAFDVYLNGKLIDTVFYTKGFDAEEVKKSLIDHDGYDPEIEIKKPRAKKKVAEETVSESFHSNEIKGAIESAKKNGEDFVRCKFGSSKFVNVNIEHLEKLASMVA